MPSDLQVHLNLRFLFCLLQVRYGQKTVKQSSPVIFLHWKHNTIVSSSKAVMKFLGGCSIGIDSKTICKIIWVKEHWSLSYCHRLEICCIYLENARGWKQILYNTLFMAQRFTFPYSSPLPQRNRGDLQLEFWEGAIPGMFLGTYAIWPIFFCVHGKQDLLI